MWLGHGLVEICFGDRDQSVNLTRNGIGLLKSVEALSSCWCV